MFALTDAERRTPPPTPVYWQAVARGTVPGTIESFDSDEARFYQATRLFRDAIYTGPAALAAFLALQPDFDSHRGQPGSALGIVIRRWLDSHTRSQAQAHLTMVGQVLAHGGWRVHEEAGSRFSGWLGRVQDGRLTLPARLRDTQTPLLAALIAGGFPMNEAQMADPSPSGMVRAFALYDLLGPDGIGEAWIEPMLAAGADPRAPILTGERWLDAAARLQVSVSPVFARLVVHAQDLDARQVPLPTPSAWMAAKLAQHAPAKRPETAGPGVDPAMAAARSTSARAT